ncbi:protein disulfide-isomerase precursor [Coemansia biformis]|uniref:Protein disulfide-isomerase n=1 Tax=Coemansia biformis TaxID=1286918 RepID=A0A9W8CZS4_9FUNG|nr:protein disulfide-isomerase precursor [Coemansia biformis]
MKVSAVRLMLSAVAALAVSGAAVAADADGSRSDVTVLTTDTFKEWTAAQELALVEFYAPWCGHCKTLAPEYEKAATALKDEGISLAKVDCTEEQALCEEMEVPGFPTLKLFRSGSPAPYNGPRREGGIVSYMRKQLLPPLSTLDADTIDKFAKSDRVVVVGFVEDSDAAEHAVLDALAKELRDEYSFGVVTDKDLAKEHGVTVPGVVVYKEFDDGKDVFGEEITAEALRAFIKTSSIPLLGEISGENYSMYAQTGLPFGFAFFDSDEVREDLTKRLLPVAKAHKGVVNFVLIDATKFASQADHLNLEHSWPAFAIQKQGNFDKFPFPQDKDITEESIAQFVEDFVGGKIDPSYKSEPVPEKNDGNVFTLVSKQFDEVVFDKAKDVLVEFYAPWCGHCKSLAPIYDKLGAVLKENKNLVIAKMDAIANDIPSSEPALQVSGFPTIVFIRGEDNDIVEYNGNRSLESLLEFIEENAAHKVTYNKSDLKDEEADEDEEEDEGEGEGEGEEAADEPKADESEAKADESEAKADEPEAKADEPEAKTDEPEADQEEPVAKDKHDEL